MENGRFWQGFRLDKYAQFISSEDLEFYTNLRKSNEPFKPFPPMNKEKARQHTHYAVEERRKMEQQQKNNSIPHCPICNSTNIKNITLSKREVNIRNNFSYQFFLLEFIKVGIIKLLNVREAI